MSGRAADRYEIEGPIGKGGMGTVLAATDRTTGQRVAIKWLGEPGSVPGDKELARFEQEARIAGSLASPHVGRVFDIGRDRETGVPYLVMELLSGEDLQALLGRVGGLEVTTALRIARQACQGLAAAHRAGVVHRDVKPSNLFLSREPGGEIVLKVVDFGIAKIKRPAAGGPAATMGGVARASGAGAPLVTGATIRAPAVTMTRTGEILGSPLYMSPEQVEASKHVDARSDVFSMGVVLYAMLTGEAPFSGIRSFVQLLYAIVTAPPPSLADVAPWVPPEVAALVDRALSKEPEERFADARAMLEALEALEACAPGGDDLREEMLIGVDRGALPATRAVAAADPRAATVVMDERPSLWRRFLGTWR